MDIRAKDLLSKIRKIEGCENAIIAGGFVRDTLLNAEKNDVDIFIPYKDQYAFNKACKTSLMPLVDPPKENENPYKKFGKKFAPVRNYMGGNGGRFIGKIDGVFESLDVDIMGYNIPNDEEFGNNVVKSFQFGLDMVYFDGFTIIETDEFLKDKDWNTITLINLEDISYLGRAMDKFIRLKAKYPNKSFATKILSLVEPKDMPNEKAVVNPLWDLDRLDDQFNDGFEDELDDEDDDWFDDDEPNDDF